MLLVWLPRDARDALAILRRPGTTALERALAASLFAEAIRNRVVGGDWLALVAAEVEKVVPDLIEPDELAADEANA